MKIKNFIKFTMAIMIAAMVICSPAGNILNGSEGAVAESAKKPAISKKKATLTVGTSVKLKVKNGKVKKWMSSRKKVATVSKTGKVVAKKKGIATITAVLKNGKKLTCMVNVKAKSDGGGSFEPAKKPQKETSSRVLPNGKKQSIDSVRITGVDYYGLYKRHLGTDMFPLDVVVETTGIKRSKLKYEWTVDNPGVMQVIEGVAKPYTLVFKLIGFGDVNVTVKVSYDGLSRTATRKVRVIRITSPYVPEDDDPVTPSTETTSTETPSTEVPSGEKTLEKVDIRSKISTVLPQDAKYIRKDNFTLTKVFSDGSREVIGDDEYELTFDSNEENTAIVYYFSVYGLGDYEYEIPMDLSNDKIYGLDVWWNREGESVDSTYTFPKEDFTFSWVYDSGKRVYLTSEEIAACQITDTREIYDEFSDYNWYSVDFELNGYTANIDVGHLV